MGTTGIKQASTEVFLVWGITMGLLWVSKLFPAFSEWQRNVFGQPFLTQAMVFVIFPLLILRMTRRNPSEYGLIFSPIKHPLEVGFTALAILGPVSGIAFPLVFSLGWSPTDWQGGLVLGVCYGASLPLVGYVVRNTQTVKGLPVSQGQIASFLLLLGSAIIVAAFTRLYSNTIANILYTLLFVGFGEELLFRGYIQSRLNQGFGASYQLLGVDYGWGLIITALLFGLAHSLSPSTPWQVGWGLWTFVVGLVFGYLREKSGTFLASAVVHGAIISIPVLFFGSL